MSDMKTLFPGTRVKIFDHLLFKDDVLTPLSHTMRPATVKRWYGSYPLSFCSGGEDGNLIDVEFDHRPGKVSKGHFAHHVEVLD